MAETDSCNVVQKLIICLCSLLAFAGQINVNAIYTITPRNILRYNYPVQEHLVHTSDGYILQTYRIPPPAPTNGSQSCIVLLQHGFTLTSDVWLLRGPTADLPFLLADTGCDVWLGNHRGNKYARRHHAYDVEDDAAQFWNFTWHEMGYHDLADTLDYVLETTQASALHYVGYSQGGLVALVLLATRPEYTKKFQTLQFLAPTAYMQNAQVPVAHWGSRWVHHLAQLLQWVAGGHSEALHFARLDLYQRMCVKLCNDESWLRSLCLAVYAALAGPISAPESYEQILPAICGTLPAGVSSKQLLHYLQLFNSGAIRQYDYGSSTSNRLQYGQDMPPFYNLSTVHHCITIYYSVADYLSAAEDVRQLGAVLPCAELRQLPHAWNHGDFVWSRQVHALHTQVIGEIKN